ncbi:hypothetical protein NFI96_003154 [Prochilodus magdalenae]|nr:hypothetical protein NFI96_003154 [Prochilodus magdalenae]
MVGDRPPSSLATDADRVSRQSFQDPLSRQSREGSRHRDPLSGILLQRELTPIDPLSDPLSARGDVASMCSQDTGDGSVALRREERRQTPLPSLEMDMAMDNQGYDNEATDSSSTWSPEVLKGVGLCSHAAGAAF